MSNSRYIMIIIKTMCLLIILSMHSNNVLAQSKTEFLKHNRYDINKTAPPILKSNTRIIGFGAYHGSAKTEVAELIILENLIKTKELKYYLPEVDVCLAYYFNQYLKTGNETLLKELVISYGKRVPHEQSYQTFEKWRSLYQLLKKYNYKITVIGPDFLIPCRLTFKYILQLLQDKANIIDLSDIENRYKSLTTGAKSTWDENIEVLATFLPKYEANRDKIEPNFELVFLMNLIKEAVLDNKSRENVIFENYVKLANEYKLSNNLQFVRMGFSHLIKSRFCPGSSFFTKLIENKIYQSSEIITILGYLTQSRVQYDNSTKGNSNIGDSWREHYLGIKYLKRNRISDLTLFHINKINSPYRNDCLDLISVCKPFRKNDYKKYTIGKTTTDFLDYALLISNSAANVKLSF